MTLFFTFKKGFDVLILRFLDHPKHPGDILFHIMPLSLGFHDVSLNGVEELSHLRVGSLVVHVSRRHKDFVVSHLVWLRDILIGFPAASSLRLFLLVTWDRNVLAIFLCKVPSQDSLRGVSLVVGLIQIVVHSLLFSSLGKVVLISLVLLL